MDERDFPPGTFWRLTLRSGQVRDAYVGDDGRAYWLTVAPDYEGPAAALGVPFIWLPWWLWRFPPLAVERLVLRPVTTCACGSPETYSLNPAEVVVHRADGPCTVGPAEPGATS